MLYRDMQGEALSAQAIIQRFYAGDQSAVKFVELFIELCAISIGNLITVLILT